MVIELATKKSLIPINFNQSPSPSLRQFIEDKGFENIWSETKWASWNEVSKTKGGTHVLSLVHGLVNSDALT